jgi:hypothetical protein
VVGYDDDAWTGHEPKGVKAEKWIIKSAFLRVVLQSEECGIDEHAPAGGSKHNLEVNSQFCKLISLKIIVNLIKT